MTECGYYTAMTHHHTMDLAARIKRRLEKLGKSERGASLEAGLSDSFLRNIRQHKSGSPRIDTLEKVAKVLDTTLGWLMTGKGEEERGETFSPDEGAAPPAPADFAAGETGEMIALTPKQLLDSAERPKNRRLYDGFGEGDEPYANIRPSPYPSYDMLRKTALPEMPNALIGKKITLSGRHLPVYGQAVGGIDGEFPINGSTLYTVLCPPQLSEISGAYAVSVSGDSMYPRYEDGELAFVDPTRRVKKGDYVIAQIMGGEGEPPLAYVKKFIRHNAGGLVLEQFNPAKELNFPHNRVISVHYIALAGTAPA